MSSKDLLWLIDYPCVMYIIFNGYAIALVIGWSFKAFNNIFSVFSVLFSWAIPLVIFFLRLLFESLFEVKRGRKIHSIANTA